MSHLTLGCCLLVDLLPVFDGRFSVRTGLWTHRRRRDCRSTGWPPSGWAVQAHKQCLVSI